MSLINDALKTAQQQRSALASRPMEHPLFQGFVPYGRRHSSRSVRELVVLGVACITVVGASGFTYARWRAAHAPKTSALAALPPISRTPAPIARTTAAPIVNSPSAHAGTTDITPKMAIQPPVKAAPSNELTVRLAGSPAPARHAGTAPSPSRADSSRNAATTNAPAAASPPAPPAPTTAPTTAPATAPVEIKVEAGTQRPVDALMSQAVAAQRQGDLDRARQLYDRAINVGPVSAALYNNYGALLNAMGNARDAIAILRLALSLDRSFTNAWINLAVAEDASGDHGAAVGALEQAIKLEPSNRDSKVNLAEQYLAIGADRDARRIGEEIVGADPSFAPGHYVLARALEAGKQSSAAARELSRFLELGGAANRPGFESIIRAHITALKAAP